MANNIKEVPKRITDAMNSHDPKQAIRDMDLLFFMALSSAEKEESAVLSELYLSKAAVTSVMLELL